MTTTGHCLTCNGQVQWQECDTGGWWVHICHPDDNHDAKPGWKPAEYMDDHGIWNTRVPMEKLTIP